MMKKSILPSFIERFWVFAALIALTLPQQSDAAEPLSASCRALYAKKILTKVQGTTLLKKCIPIGSSAGVTRGDFNGDGFADLAIGVPQEGLPSPKTNVRAGAVTIVYGSRDKGLNGEPVDGRPGAQMWFQGRDGVPLSPVSGDLFGAALAAGEFNGDGFSDLAIGIPGKDSGGLSNTGAIVVLYGSASGLSANRAQKWFMSDFPQVFGAGLPHASRSNDRFGASVAWGDFDLDGFGDLVVGIPGKSFLVFNNGGFAPVPDPGTLLTGAGAVLMIKGSAGGLTTSGSQYFRQPAAGIEGQTTVNGLISTTFSRPESGDAFGSSFTSGDYNGDKFPDLAIGVPREDIMSKTDAGAVNVFLGPTFVVNDDSFFNPPSNILFIHKDRLFQGAMPGDTFGSSLATGNFDGDEFADLVIGAPFDDLEPGVGFNDVPLLVADAGTVTTLSRGADATISFGFRVFTTKVGVSSKDFFGTTLATGNFDGNQFTDLAVGVPGRDLSGVVDAGEVQVFCHAPPEDFFHLNSVTEQRWNMGTLSAANSRLQANARFGSVLSAWNFGRNFDGAAFGDLAIGVPFLTATQSGSAITNAGGVFAIYGTKNCLTDDPKMNPSQLLQQGIGGVPDFSEQADLFGGSLY